MQETNFLDLAAMGYSAWGFRRGYQLGFAKQLRRLVDLATGCLTGVAVYKGLGDKVADLLSFAPGLAASASFVLSGGGAFVIIRILRRKLRLLIMRQLRKLDGIWGAILGAGRNLTLSGAGIFAAGIGPSVTVGGWSQNSAIGSFLFSLFG